MEKRRQAILMHTQTHVTLREMGIEAEAEREDSEVNKCIEGQWETGLNELKELL